MNVAFDPWIPVVDTTGVRTTVSLNAIFRDGDRYADLAVRPHERVSLMRLILCVAHASLDGPKNYDEWCEVPNRLPGSATTYLEKWKDSFELFHPEKPWLQVAELDVLKSDDADDTDDEKGWASLNKLSFTKASGINTTLFDHPSIGGEHITYADDEIALNLLTFQNFFVAGGKASERKWGNELLLKPKNPKGGPCSGKSILFTFLRGSSVSETIHLNLNTWNDLNLIYGDVQQWMGKPLWELPIQSPSDDRSIENATKTHLGRLVPQTRMLRTHEDRKRVLLGPGFVYPKFQDEKNTFFEDQFATIKVRQNERELLSAKPGRALFRELHSLLVKKMDANSSARGSLCLMNSPGTSPCDIVVCSMSTNPKQAAEIVDIIESVYHIPAQLRTQAGAHIYTTEIENAESWASILGLAIESYRSEWALKERLHSTGTTSFWTTVEKNLSLLFAHIEAIGTDASESSLSAWRKMLSRAAHSAYRIACGQETPRQMKAFAKGYQRLISTTEKTNSHNTIRKEEEHELVD